MAEDWIKHPIILKGKVVDLLPLEKEHLEELFIAASDEKLWEFIPTDCSSKNRFMEVYTTAISEREAGRQYPFLVYHKSTGKLVGSTRLFEIVAKDRKLEIGWTWIMAEHWRTAVNIECKYLLLKYCFEELKALRVQLKTDELNTRSRKAIEKIGAKFEGILRKDRIKDNGMSRNAAYYSIIDDEWSGVKKELESKLGW
jgi:RimJ/RimL family protein N-acetyltransferase